MEQVIQAGLFKCTNSFTHHTVKWVASNLMFGSIHNLFSYSLLYGLEIEKIPLYSPDCFPPLIRTKKKKTLLCCSNFLCTSPLIGIWMNDLKNLFEYLKASSTCLEGSNILYSRKQSLLEVVIHVCESLV